MGRSLFAFVLLLGASAGAAAQVRPDLEGVW